MRFPMKRMSWYSKVLWITDPALMNKSALNRACVKRWKNASSGQPKERMVIISPSWLSVERAIIFFISVSR